jgi:hypothetical protein
MNSKGMTVEDCTDLCPKNDRSGTRCVFVSTVEIRTLKGEKRTVEVKRCAYCDTTPCAICDTRTMRVSQKRCTKCGHDLIPRSTK